jgi:hypothetical protein
MSNYRRFKPSIFAVVVFTITTASGTRADDLNDPLGPLAWTVGGAWIAEIQDDNGKPLSVHVSFKWASHHKAIDYVVSFESQGKRTPRYEGTYYWHPGKKRIAMLQLDYAGGVTESTMTVDGKLLKQENVLTTSDGVKHEQRVELTRTGEDSYHFKALIQRDGQWVEGVAFPYKRIHDKKAG